jgi:hypothetical protein
VAEEDTAVVGDTAAVVGEGTAEEAAVADSADSAAAVAADPVQEEVPVAVEAAEVAGGNGGSNGIMIRVAELKAGNLNRILMKGAEQRDRDHAGPGRRMGRARGLC